MPLTNKEVAIVCGGSSGIGLETVKLLSKELYTYNIDLQESKESVPNSETLICDLSDGVSLDMIFNTLLMKDLHVTKFFFSAGIHHNGYLEDTEDAIYDKLQDTNVKSMFKALKHILKNMKAFGSGSIVLMSSEQSIIGRPRNPVYAMTKGAVAQLTRSLAIDNAALNIRINAVAPGTTFTSMYEMAVAKASSRIDIPVENIYEDDAASIPVKRLARPKEIANVVDFLLSDKASYITGVNLPVDGGATIE